jgi:hypothetical protein
VTSNPSSVSTGNSTRYTPNHIPYKGRVLSIIFSTLLLGYGIVAFVIDDLYLPGRRSGGMHLHGNSLYIMLAAFACAAANLVSVVVDHYDRRNNETNYRRFARVTRILGWLLFGLAIILDILVFHTATR